ncbi:MAG: hypothetical protein COV70_01230 [Parcubacteria group bacterium CG11_big_fil_rev_8_21_14_0_20_39_22]|nr:MAG: hypothetical protein COV70_01230 [Parcubacteria group bacterium CG11_big_fil_rev_8_21_14_0_20_39_22]
MFTFKIIEEPKYAGISIRELLEGPKCLLQEIATRWDSLRPLEQAFPREGNLYEARVFARCAVFTEVFWAKGDF